MSDVPANMTRTWLLGNLLRVDVPVIPTRYYEDTRNAAPLGELNGSYWWIATYANKQQSILRMSPNKGFYLRTIEGVAAEGTLNKKLCKEYRTAIEAAKILGL